MGGFFDVHLYIIIRLFVYLFICLFVHLVIYLSIYLFVFWDIYNNHLYIYNIHSFIFLCIYLFVYLLIYAYGPKTEVAWRFFFESEVLDDGVGWGGTC